MRIFLDDKPKRRVHRRDERGMVLAATMFIVVIMITLSMAMLAAAYTSSDIQGNNETTQSAYDSSESGISDVMVGLNNGTIPSGTQGFNSATDQTAPGRTDGSTYDWTAYTNISGSLVDVPNPNIAGAGPCNSVPDANNDAGPGCVSVPPQGEFVAVTGYYLGKQTRVEAMALANTVTDSNHTILDYQGGTQTGKGGVVADPTDPTQHDVNILSDGNWTATNNTSVDGNVTTVGATDTANVCNTCSATSNQTAAYVAPPSNNNLAQAKSQWVTTATSDGCYFTGAPSAGFTINPGEVCYIEGDINLKGLSSPIYNNGGTLVVGGNVTETGNGANSNYQMAPGATCSTHNQSWLVVLGTQGVAIHGVGNNKNNVVSQGVIYVPNGNFTTIGNGYQQASVIAQSTSVGGNSTMVSDHCAAQGHLRLPGFNVVSYGDY